MAHYRQRPDSYEFQLVRAKLRAADGRPDEAVAFFRGALAEKRFVDEGAVRYGYAAALARAKDFKGAEDELGALRKIGRRHAMHETLAARVKAEAGDFAGSGADSRCRPPEVSRRRRVKLEHAEMLQRLGRNREAVEVLNDLAKQRPQWPRVYSALAQSYSDLGQRMQQHRALAESYYLQGGLASAIEQLQLAQSAGDGDFYTLSTVDVRLRELKALQAEEIKERRQKIEVLNLGFTPSPAYRNTLHTVDRSFFAFCEQLVLGRGAPLRAGEKRLHSGGLGNSGVALLNGMHELADLGERRIGLQLEAREHLFIRHPQFAVAEHRAVIAEAEGGGGHACTLSSQTMVASGSMNRLISQAAARRSAKSGVLVAQWRRK